VFAGKVKCSFVGETDVPTGNSMRHCICTLRQWDDEIDQRFVS